MNPRRILPIVLILALVGGGVYYYFRIYSPAQAASGALAASGTIETTTTNVSPEVSGRVVAVNFQEGDAVHAGDVLVRLDPTLLQAQRKQAAAALAAAQANYASLQAGAASQQLQAALAGAQLQVLAAQQTITDLNDKAPLAAAQADQAVAVAQTALTKAVTDLSNLTTAKPTPDADTLALAQANDKLAAAVLADAQSRATRLSGGPDPDVLALAQARLSAAQAGLAAAQAALAPVQLDAAKAQVDTAQAALDLLDAQLGRLVVVAPVDGVVLSRAIEPGEVASPGATLLVLGGLTDLRVTVYVPEARVGQVKLGSSARLSVDSYLGRVFEAKVLEIANQAEFTPRNAQTVEGRKDTVYAVKLSIANPDQALKPGMPADVAFQP